MINGNKYMGRLNGLFEWLHIRKTGEIVCSPRTAYESTYFEYGSILESLHIVEFGHALKERHSH
jgi:hypothetical protein